MSPPKEIVVTNFNLVIQKGSVNSNQTLRVCQSSAGKDWGAGYYLKTVSKWAQTDGRTQINVGKIETTMQVYLSTNTALTVTNVLATVSPTLNYYRSTGANRTTLKFVNGSTAGTIVKGSAPNVLPRRIEGHQGALTIEVSNVSGESLPAGLYPILTCTSGGTALSASNWPVTFTGWRQDNLSLERGETGLWLRVRGGMMIIVQ